MTSNQNYSYNSATDVVRTQLAESTQRQTQQVPLAATSGVGSAEDKNRRNDFAMMSFPQKLMTLLSDERVNHIMSWTADGKSFTIYDLKTFATFILPIFSNRPSFERFLQKLYQWGFSKSEKGRLRNIDMSATFFHEKFQKDNYELCSRMVKRRRSREESGSTRRSAVRPVEDVYSPHAHFAELSRNLRMLYGRKGSSTDTSSFQKRQKQNTVRRANEIDDTSSRKKEEEVAVTCDNPNLSNLCIQDQHHRQLTGETNNSPPHVDYPMP